MEKIRISPLWLVMSIFFFVGINSVYAEDADCLPRAADFSGMLGWTSDEAYNRLGAPEEFFPYTDESGEECVVFYFKNHTYLFWYEGRVWQIRADRRWEGELDGIVMGSSRNDVEELWGPPINDFDENPTWTLPDRGYPVRIRLYFNEADRLVDLYVYRSDW